jgi:hypothetical protein
MHYSRLKTLMKATFELYQGQIASIIQTAMAQAAMSGPPIYTKQTLLVDEPGEALERRCGCAFENAYKHDRKFLFLDVLYDPVVGEGKSISSFYVRSSVYFAFFRRPIYSSSANVISYQERPTRGVDMGNEMSLHNLETQVQSQNDRPQDGHLQNTPSAGVILLEKRQAAIVPTSNETETTQEASNAIVRFGDQQELEEDTEIVCLPSFLSS